MSERDIEFLLDKYEKAYVEGERTSNEYQKKSRYERWRKNRHLILDELLLEANGVTLSNNQIKIIRYLIDEFNENFRSLHYRSSDETIILAFIFYMKKVESPRIRLNNYRICTKYELTDTVFEIITCRLLLHFMKKCPIRPYHNYNNDKHEILIREGKRR